MVVYITKTLNNSHHTAAATAPAAAANLFSS